MSCDNDSSFKQEAECAREELPARLFLAVSSDEDLSAPVQKFMQTLQSRGYKGLELETHVIEGERHASNKREVYNRRLRFAFRE